MIMNIILVSHCNFSGQSAYHVHSIAKELAEHGCVCILCVPDGAKSAAQHVKPAVPVINYNDALKKGLVFPDGCDPTLIHCWTPREHVRQFTETLVEQYGCPYVVHLEDNEREILNRELDGMRYEDVEKLHPIAQNLVIPPHRIHPWHHWRFMNAAAGSTVLMDRLFEHVPDGIPGLVVWPGYDEIFANVPTVFQSKLRKKYDISDNAFVILYSGNFHAVNQSEIRKMLVALALLKRQGIPLHFIKTGINELPDIFEPKILDTFMTDLGFVPRLELPELLAIADVLIQPGTSDAFNDYRFPSKLPEALISRKPVILPRSNLGRFLDDGVNALITQTGRIDELVDKIITLFENPDLRRTIGANGQAFAREHLQWGIAAEKILTFYKEQCLPRASVIAKQPQKYIESCPLKLIAFYLPQFQPIPENDQLQGEGFTEWINVRKAISNISGSFHPRVPADLGYYDLRDIGIMHQQVALARANGIDGFCFYYHWFSGKRLFEKPLDNWLKQETHDFPFCICWANENLSRHKNGGENDTLIEQVYSHDNDEKFIRDVLPLLKDTRYIRVNNAPLLLVYRADLLPYPAQTTETWRRICKEEGIPEIHLAAVQTFALTDPRPYGFDAAVEFPPSTSRYLLDPARVPGVTPGFAGHLEDYLAIVANLIGKPDVDYVLYRGIIPAWDNTALRGNHAHVLINESPRAYGQWLRYLTREALKRTGRQTPLIFINAWNDWTEGAYLEPDTHNRDALLRATKNGKLQGMLDHIKQEEHEISGNGIELNSIAKVSKCTKVS
jgi:glycosyltransferase involved in cell wall biosynthesis